MRGFVLKFGLGFGFHAIVKAMAKILASDDIEYEFDDEEDDDDAEPFTFFWIDGDDVREMEISGLDEGADVGQKLAITTALCEQIKLEEEQEH
jgi:hypothetical protein